MAETAKKNVFETLNKINVNEHTELKNGLTYLSWAWAWAEVKKNYPDAVYSIKRFENNLPYVYDQNTGYMVFTEVTINGITHEMWLPVMDSANKAMKAESYQYKVKNPNFKYAKQDMDGRWVDKYGKEQPEYLTKNVAAADMFDVNKTIMRCLVKNLAIFGLGLYIYAGEDLPNEEDSKKGETPKRIAEKQLEDKELKLTTDVAFNEILENKYASEQQIKMITQISERIGQPLEKICNTYMVKRLEDLTPSQATEVIEKLKGTKK